MSSLERVMRIVANITFQEMTESESRCHAMLSTRAALYRRQCDIQAFKMTVCELYYWDYEPAVEHLALNPEWDPTTDLVSLHMCEYFEIIIRTCRAVRRHSLSFQSRGLARFLGRLHNLRGTWEQLQVALCNLHSSVIAQQYVQQLQLDGLSRRINRLGHHCFHLRKLYAQARFVVAHAERHAALAH